MGKVVFLVRSLNAGGAERQLVVLARALHRRGVKVVVSVFYAGGVFQKDLDDAGIRVVDLEKAGRWSNLGVLWRLCRLLLRERPSVVHGYLQVANTLLLLLTPWLHLLDIKVVCGVRGAGVDLTMYDWTRAAVERIQNGLLRFADLVIGNSRAGLRHVAANVVAERSVHVPNGIQVESYHRCEGKRRWQREAWGLVEDDVVIGLVARLDPVKNHRALMAAAAVLLPEHARLRFICVGAGDSTYEELLREEARALGIAGRFAFVGHSGDVVAVYSALDICALVSTSEGFPNVLGEAMSCGLPCVTTDVGDAALVIGDCGWVVPSGNGEALAGALREAIAALPSWDPGRSRARVLENFSVDRMVERTLGVLRPWLEMGP